MSANNWQIDFLSQAATNVLYKLMENPAPSGITYFPQAAVKEEHIRVKNHNDLRPWFLRCANDVGGPEFLTVEDNIVIVGKSQWGTNGLVAVSAQALVLIDTTFDDYYLTDDTFQVQYFRLDLDLPQPGPLFCEPQPHLHTNPTEEPRMVFSCTSDRTLIVDFIEFLYLNYDFKKWKSWAKKVWEREKKFPLDQDPFDRIVLAYANPKTSALLQNFGQHINDLREVLRKEKCRVAESLHPIAPDAHALNYCNFKAC